MRVRGQALDLEGRDVVAGALAQRARCAARARRTACRRRRARAMAAVRPGAEDGRGEDGQQDRRGTRTACPARPRHRVEPAAAPGGGDREHRPSDDRQSSDHRQRPEQRGAGADQQAREQVAALAVEAERSATRVGPDVRVGEVDLRWGRAARASARRRPPTPPATMMANDRYAQEARARQPARAAPAPRGWPRR